MSLSPKIKKIISWGSASLCIVAAGLSFSPAARAAIGSIADQLLQQISDNTLGTLNAVNNLPTLLEPITTFANSWTNPDKSDNTKSLKGILPLINSDTIQNMSTQNAQQARLLNDFFGDPSKTKDSLSYANDLSYQTLINLPYFSTDPRGTGKDAPDSAYNYIKYASGINNFMRIPGSDWTGPAYAQKRYANYFLTITSAQTFDAYILSSIYANYKNGSDLNTQQAALYALAKDTKPWFTQIAGENLGSVLRQILMFNSQTYILLTQLLETQKQLLAAQVINNSVVVLLAQISLNNDLALYSRAAGTVER